MHLLCVGEAFTDLIFLRMARIPRAGEELRTGHFAATVGGGAVITAVAASRIGLRARVMSALGPDAVARLRAERVSLINVIRPGERAAVSVAISTARDRSFVTFDGVNDQLEGRLWRRRRDIRAPFVHFAFAPRDCARWAAVVRRLQQAGSVTSWDFGWHQNLASRRGFHGVPPAQRAAANHRSGRTADVPRNPLRPRLIQRQQVFEKTIRAWYRVGQLAMKCVGAVGVIPLAESGREPAAALRRLTAIPGLDQRRVFRGPRRPEF